jgi:transcriptional regulator with XRE-family HTH domain
MAKAETKNYPAEIVELYRHIAKNVRALRKEKELSQRQLALAVGMNQSTINELETDVIRDMRLSTVGKLAKALEVEISDLLVPKGFNVSAKGKKEFKEALQVLKKIYAQV